MVEQIYDYEDYPIFVKNLQRIQYHNYYNSEWYNNIIDWLAAKPYDEAVCTIDLLNDFFCTGLEMATIPRREKQGYYV